MSGDDRQHQMDFILRQQAAFSSEMVELKGRLDQIGVTVRQQGENIDKLTASVQSLTDNVETMREEMRDGFNKLIVANEVTRKLAEDVARLTINVSQRLTEHEQRPHETNASDPS